MYYLSEQTVSNAYSNIINTNTPNKLWGLLSILHEIDSYPIKTNHTYTLPTKGISLWLDEILYCGNERKEYGERDCFVRFPNEWIENIADPSNGILKKDRINILDIACFVYKFTPFEKKYSSLELVAKLMKELNLSEEMVSSWFINSHYDLAYEEFPVSKSSLLAALKEIKNELNDCISFELPIKSRPGEITRAPFVQTLYAGTNALKCLMFATFNLEELYPTYRNAKIEIDKMNLQQIFYGAPGTGKSKTIKDKTEIAEKDNRVFRTTFHPDSDYSTFVGCYKPGMKSGDRIYSAEELAVKLKEIKNSGVTYPCHKFAAQYWRSLKDLSADAIKQILNACGFTESMNVEVSKGVAIGQEYLNKDEDGKIVYTFTPQAFTNAYVKAWSTTEDVYLIIEEINRGNCAQIFGDLFQLLDRGDNGLSEYPIEADTDLRNYIAKELENSTRSDFPNGVKEGEKLILPSNLYIWATMNTSDQSLFPIDSAFKRRWDWQYVPIHDGGKGWQIKADGKRYDWWKFVDAMNDKIGTATYSEDKKLGYFFCKAKDGVIDAETFVGKVVFYIWNDVFKDFAEEAGNLFKDVDGSMLSFNKFYTIGTDGKRKVVEPKIAILMQNLGVEPITTSNSANDDEPEEDEDNNDDSGSKVRLTITFPDGDMIAGNTKFESYRGALEKIGIQQTLPIAEEKVYQRHNCSLIDTTQRDGILNDPVYSYVKVGDYYIVKGINGKTMRNMLSLISNRLNLDLIINYQ